MAIPRRNMPTKVQKAIVSIWRAIYPTLFADVTPEGYPCRLNCERWFMIVYKIHTHQEPTHDLWKDASPTAFFWSTKSNPRWRRGNSLLFQKRNRCSGIGSRRMTSRIEDVASLRAYSWVASTKERPSAVFASLDIASAIGVVMYFSDNLNQ